MIFRFDYGPEDREAPYEADVKVTPGSPAITSGPADNWYPGDPAEIEVLAIREEGSKAVVPQSLHEEIEEYLLDKREDDILAQADEEDKQAREDAAEAKAEAREVLK